MKDCALGEAFGTKVEEEYAYRMFLWSLKEDATWKTYS